MYIPQAQSISSQNAKPKLAWKSLIIQAVSAWGCKRLNWTARATSPSVQSCVVQPGLWWYRMPPLYVYGASQVIALSTKATGHPLARSCRSNASMPVPGRRGKIRSANLPHICSEPASIGYFRCTCWLRPFLESASVACWQRDPDVGSRDSRNGGHRPETRIGSGAAGFKFGKIGSGYFRDGGRDYAEDAGHRHRPSFRQPCRHGSVHCSRQAPWAFGS